MGISSSASSRTVNMGNPTNVEFEVQVTEATAKRIHLQQQQQQTNGNNKVDEKSDQMSDVTPSRPTTDDVLTTFSSIQRSTEKYSKPTAPDTSVEVNVGEQLHNDLIAQRQRLQNLRRPSKCEDFRTKLIDCIHMHSNHSFTCVKEAKSFNSCLISYCQQMTDAAAAKASTKPPNITRNNYDDLLN